MVEIFSGLAAGGVANAPGRKDAGVAGVFGAAVGGLGWLTTENVIWLIPIVLSLWAGLLNAWYLVKFHRAKARFDLKIYKVRTAKESGLDIAVLNTPDPDSEI